MEWSDLDAVRRLVDSGADARDINELYSGWTPLHLAVSKGNLPVVQFLLERGADVSMCDDGKGSVPLHYVFDCDEPSNYHRLTKLLLENGADPNTENFDEVTPFHCALPRMHLDIVKLLLDYGADVDQGAVFGTTAIHYAAMNSDIGVIKFIFEQSSIDIDSLDENERTPLFYAARRVDPEACEYLLKCRATVDLVSDVNTTPMTEAAGMVHLYIESRGLSVMNLLMRYLAKELYISRLEIHCEDREIIQGNDGYKNYYEMCWRELESMTVTKFYGNVSVFSLCKKNAKSVTVIADNRESVEAIEGLYHKHFPIYFDLIKERLNIVVKNPTM